MEVKIMKKLLAVLLALICAFSVVAPASAATLDDLVGILGGQLGLEQEEDEADILSYGIHYEVSSLSTVVVYYTPSPNITFNAPTDLKVTDDTPVALDHDWVCWKDPATGEFYYPGDTIHVDGKITLEAVWAEKTDKHPAFIRSVVAGLKAIIKLIEKYIGIYDFADETRKEAQKETTTVAA